MSAMAFREPNEVRWVGVRPAHKGTQGAESSLANGSTVVIKTVSSGKTLYLHYFFLSWRFTATGQTVQLTVRNASDVDQYDLIKITSGAAGQGAEAVSLHYPIEIPQGWDIYVKSDTSGALAIGGIVYWEE
jgi:hypothetical protein